MDIDYNRIRRAATEALKPYIGAQLLSSEHVAYCASQSALQKVYGDAATVLELLDRAERVDELLATRDRLLAEIGTLVVRLEAAEQRARTSEINRFLAAVSRKATVHPFPVPAAAELPDTEGGSLD
jgi:hypothetical protein